MARVNLVRLAVQISYKASGPGNMKFAFNLDPDGVKEDLPMIRPGSGFLALDPNNDGIITNGNELFGPRTRTGNGFAELSVYDEDGNNLIDENDPVYDQLSVCTISQQGDGVLFEN